MSRLTAIASDATLDTAFAWLCKRRQNYPDHADVWNFRGNWQREKERIRAELCSGRYRFGLVDRVTRANGDAIDLWSARDALVLKAMTIALEPVLPISRSCVHVKGHGGATEAVRRVAKNLANNRFVMRTDVKSFYASIDHHLLMERIAKAVKEKRVVNLIGQYLRRTVERGGQFFDYERGISLGCPLSPLFGAFFLTDLDRGMERLGLFYVRFMDDILVQAPTRWRLRRAVKAVTRMLGALRLEKHPDKTFIGKIERGFDFLGFHFSRGGLRIAKATVRRFVEHAARLYEQDREEPSMPSRLGRYVRRWVGWAKSGWHPGDPNPTKRPRDDGSPRTRPPVTKRRPIPRVRSRESMVPISSPLSAGHASALIPNARFRRGDQTS
jgi:hypothetical protein